MMTSALLEAGEGSLLVCGERAWPNPPVQGPRQAAESPPDPSSRPLASLRNRFDSSSSSSSSQIGSSSLRGADLKGLEEILLPVWVPAQVGLAKPSPRIPGAILPQPPEEQRSSSLTRPAKHMPDRYPVPKPTPLPPPATPPAPPQVPSAKVASPWQQQSGEGQATDQRAVPPNWRLRDRAVLPPSVSPRFDELPRGATENGSRVAVSLSARRVGSCPGLTDACPLEATRMLTEQALRSCNAARAVEEIQQAAMSRASSARCSTLGAITTSKELGEMAEFQGCSALSSCLQALTKNGETAASLGKDAPPCSWRKCEVSFGFELESWSSLLTMLAVAAFLCCCCCCCWFSSKRWRLLLRQHDGSNCQSQKHHSKEYGEFSREEEAPLVSACSTDSRWCEAIEPSRRSASSPLVSEVLLPDIWIADPGMSSSWGTHHPGHRPLRFGIGDRIECRMGDRWHDGEVVATDFSHLDATGGDSVPYVVRLDHGEHCAVSVDENSCIREGRRYSARIAGGRDTSREASAGPASGRRYPSRDAGATSSKGR
mmetsp:Transcript_23093/g.49159  ORF Transcript_23093/g.49159 Transcript_23093/m.49159 type:complete len:543 (-) Transcript_23093:283-1911(-)